ncbi:hypothetical protein [Palleniella muris]|uniref:hypothetical protein n=1 Tax=Palleniella muris TaxID=3038145 RepID=UPI001441FB3B|nr:hypothetical protein [Palleniella muris]
MKPLMPYCQHLCAKCGGATTLTGNVPDKPNEQSETCFSYAVARGGRAKLNHLRL